MEHFQYHFLWNGPYPLADPVSTPNLLISLTTPSPGRLHMPHVGAAVWLGQIWWEQNMDEKTILAGSYLLLIIF